MNTESTTPRREMMLATALAAGAMLAACAGNRAGDESKKPGSEDDIPPTEDLMREHGVLSRVMMIYDDAALRIETGGMDVDPGVISQASTIVRTFIEEYHEKLEEEYLFPRFEGNNMHKDLILILRVQHNAGRRLTAEIAALANGVRIVNTSDRRELAASMRSFNRLYRPHAAREDTVLFPSLRKIVTPHELDALGEEFEAKETELFGQDGFESIVAKVASLERQVGLFDLNQFTPT